MIRATGLFKSFATAQGPVIGLDGVDLEVAAGEFVVVIGTNGSGKSTLLNAIAGNVSLDRGSIQLDGTEVTQLPDFRRAKRIARVFQNPYHGTAAELSVAENLRMAELRTRRRMLSRRWSPSAYRDRLAAYGLGLEDRLTVPAVNLSGGQRQALTLAMATLETPSVLLLDEHTAALDPEAADTLMTATDRIVRERSIATLMVTHSMEQACRFGDRLVLIHRGRIVEEIRDRSTLSPSALHAKFAALYGR